jgi:hypothetical protein
MEWLGEKKRQTQINNSPKSADEAYFGYERISTVAKTDRVIQHFNSVARIAFWTCVAERVTWQFWPPERSVRQAR